MIGKYLLKKGDINHPLYHKSYINKIYNINGFLYIKEFQEIFEYNTNTHPYSKGKILGYTEIFSLFYNGVSTYYIDLNGQQEPNKKIASFYEALKNINIVRYSENFGYENVNLIPLYGIINIQKIFLEGGTQDHDTWFIEGLPNGEIQIFGENVMGEYFYILPYLEGKTTFTKKEFYLFMKLYYGIYQEEKLLKELENNEKIGKYDDIKKLLNNYKIDGGKYIDWEKMLLDKRNNGLKFNEDLMEEYLKLELIKIDTSGAFDGIKIEKVFDKDWDEEKQLDVVDKINKEFGEEILIYK